MPITVIEHEDDAPLGHFAGWLGLEYHVVRPYLGEPVPASAPGGLIVLGGEASAWDDAGYPWLPATRELLRGAVAGGVPTLGVCLGAQLMTMACGGAVRRGDRGLEIGVARVEPLPEAAGDPLLGGLRAPAPAIQYHYDVMAELPPGAVRLAAGAVYPNQAYRLGSRAWAVQFHPEATTEIFTGWTASGAAAVAEAGHDVAALDAGVKEAEAELESVWRPVAEAFAALVRGR
jgi:GMP synthase-like glutamine amidotransferase